MTNYVAKANWYINQVLSGSLPACVYVKQACARQKMILSDLPGKTSRLSFQPGQPPGFVYSLST